MGMLKLLETITTTADTPAVDWTALLSADTLATLYDESRVVLVFRSGRSAEAYLRAVADEDEVEMEIPPDPVAEPEVWRSPPMRWKDRLAFLYASATVALVVEVYRKL